MNVNDTTTPRTYYYILPHAKKDLVIRLALRYISVQYLIRHDRQFITTTGSRWRELMDESDLKIEIDLRYIIVVLVIPRGLPEAAASDSMYIQQIYHPSCPYSDRG